MNHNIQSCEVIGIDIAKNSFALHGADASGKPVYKFTGSRRKMLSKLTKAPSTKIYMEACGGAHCLGREFEKMGHAVELIPSIYVKAFVKRQKNDANDAAAIVEAASRPTMRKLKIKSEATQARASLFRARQLLVSQRTQTANSVRGLLTEFGVTVAKGLQNLERLRELVSMNKELPDDLLLALDVLFTTMDRLNEAIDFLTKAIGTEVSRDEDAKRLMEIPGIGPITAFAILAFAGDLNGLLLAKYFVPFLVTKNVPHVGHFVTPFRCGACAARSASGIVFPANSDGCREDRHVRREVSGGDEGIVECGSVEGRDRAAAGRQPPHGHALERRP